jgi:peptide chain release factor 2
MAAPAFWSDPAGAQKVMQRRKRIESDLETLKRLRSQEDDAKVLLDWLEAGEDVAKDLPPGLDALEQTIEAAEFQKMLGGEHDRADAILTINSGAGGTDSQDWAEMLLRMYLRWCDRRGFKRDITDIQSGEEAGIKSTTVLVQGEYAFGYLSAEAGVHRLVRISPFDSNARRQTSFASVFAWPEIEDAIEIDIQDKELRVDTYRASGAGGQHVNKTDSAVRITHRPSGIVVQCQNERSQSSNRATAMAMLRAKLLERKERERQEEIAREKGEAQDVNFGSQIRSYVLHPYTMVKDHRTNHEMGDVQRVLDGDLDGFVRAYLLATAGTGD